MFSGMFSEPGHFFITSLISLFVVIDPPGNVLSYLAFAAGYSRREARGLALRACLYAFLILLSFILLGRLILNFFGISLPAFQIAGGLILFRIAFDMLEGRGHFNRLDTSSSLVPGDYRDIALAPLAMPLLAGPGAISTILVLTSGVQDLVHAGLLILALVAVLAAAYLFFRSAERFLGFMKESGLRLLTRLMGLILAALAVQFVITGVRAAWG